MRRLRRFGFNRIKEGFDQLPTAICFFDSRGSIVLCNRQMYRLSHYLFESDMQYLGEVERALANPPEGILQLSNMEGTYRFPDNTIWQFEKTEVTDMEKTISSLQLRMLRNCAMCSDSFLWKIRSLPRMKNICKGYLKMWRRLPGRKNF